MRKCLNCQYLILQWASSWRFLTIESKFLAFNYLTALVLNHVIHIFRVRAISQTLALNFSCVLFQKVSTAHASSLCRSSKYIVTSFSTSSAPGVSAAFTSCSQAPEPEFDSGIFLNFSPSKIFNIQFESLVLSIQLLLHSYQNSFIKKKLLFWKSYGAYFKMLMYNFFELRF